MQFPHISKDKDFSLLKRFKNNPEIIEIRNREVKQNSINGLISIPCERVEDLLGISVEAILKWEREGIITIYRNQVNDIVFSNIRVDELFQFCKNYTLTDEAINFLGVNKSTLLSWARQGYFKIYANGVRRYLLNIDELKRFKIEYYMDVADVANYLKVSKYYIYRLVNRQELNPIKIYGKYIFNKNEIDELKRKLDELLLIDEVAQLTSLDYKEIIELIKRGRLNPVQTYEDGDLRRYLLSRSEVNGRLKIMNSKEVAEYLGISEVTVRKYAREKRIKAISGPNIDGMKYYKYNLVHVEKFKEELNLLKKSRGERAQYKLLPLSEVAKILNIRKQYAWDMVQQGKLNAYRGPNIDGFNQYMFREYDILRFKDKFKNNIVSATEAANMLGEDLSWFYKKYVKTGRIETIEFKDDIGKYFFKKEDIDNIVRMKNNTITGSVVAKNLGVTRGTILKWNKKGKITPISGPSIDGFGVYLYLKSDVEKLRKDKS